MPTTLETCFNNQASLPLRFNLVSSFGVITSGNEITIGYVPNICFPVSPLELVAFVLIETLYK